MDGDVDDGRRFAMFVFIDDGVLISTTLSSILKKNQLESSICRLDVCLTKT